MASADTMLTSDIIRQGASKTQQKTTKTENALLRDVKKRLEAMEMKSWAELDILERARELGAAASVDRLVTEILDDPEKSSWQSQGRSNEGKKPAPRPSASATTRGPRGPRTGGKFEEGQSRRSNGAEGGDKFEYRRSGKFGDRKNEDSPQNGHRDENRRANGEHRGRPHDKGTYGEREGKQQQQQKPVAPAVPATTWTSIVKKNLPTASVSEETIVVSGKDASQKEQSANSKSTKGNNKNKANSQPSSAPSEPTTTDTTSPSPVEDVPVEVAPIEVAPVEPVAVETPVVETQTPVVEASPAASVAEKKDENVTGGRGRRAGGRNNRREKEAVPAVENGESPSPQAQEPAAETPAAAAQSKASGAKVILPSAFSGVSNQPTRRGFASSHVKVNAPAAAAAPAAAPAAVAPVPTPVAAAAAPAPAVPVAATAPDAQLLATAPASSTVAAPPAAANPVATTVPPALTSSLPPHMTGSHNSMPHGMFPNMNMHYPGQFFQPQEYFQPEMYSHMMGPYPPFMPMGTAGPRNTHDNKSPASTNPQSTNPSQGPSLNSQSGAMPPMFPPYMMNPLPYYMPFPAAMQSQGPNTGSNNGHYNPQQSRYGTGRAPSNPTPTYDHQEESHFYQPRSGYTDPYSSGGYPSSHHGQSHGQEQKPYGQDPNKSYDDHSHAYNAFGHSGSFSH